MKWSLFAALVFALTFAGVAQASVLQDGKAKVVIKAVKIDEGEKPAEEKKEVKKEVKKEDLTVVTESEVRIVLSDGKTRVLDLEGGKRTCGREGGKGGPGGGSMLGRPGRMGGPGCGPGQMGGPGGMMPGRPPMVGRHGGMTGGPGGMTGRHSGKMGGPADGMVQALNALCREISGLRRELAATRGTRVGLSMGGARKAIRIPAPPAPPKTGEKPKRLMLGGGGTAISSKDGKFTFGVVPKGGAAGVALPKAPPMRYALETANKKADGFRKEIDGLKSQMKVLQDQMAGITKLLEELKKKK